MPFQAIFTVATADVGELEARRIDKLPKDKALAALQQIDRSVKRLINLMESTLSASRLEAGTIKITPKTCDIGTLPASIRADEQLLRQAVSNLLSNAAKYSPNAENVRILGRTDGDMAVISTS